MLHSQRFVANTAFIFYIAVSFLLYQHASFAAVDEEKVRQIAAIEIEPPPAPAVFDLIQTANKGVEDIMLTIMRERSPQCLLSKLPLTDPRWDQVRDALYEDYKNNAGATRQSMETSRYNSVVTYIANHMSSADIDSMLAFYATPLGQRYKQMQSDLNGLVSVENHGPRSYQGMPSEAVNPEIAHAQFLVELSNYSRRHAMKLVDSNRSLNSRMKMMEMQQNNIQRSRVAAASGFNIQDSDKAQFEAIYQKYLPDLRYYETFEESEAWQNFVSTYYDALMAPADFHAVNVFFHDEYDKTMAACAKLGMNP